MDRREFIGSSLAAAGSALVPGCVPAHSETHSSTDQIPGAVVSATIANARFPKHFLWGMATAAYQVEARGKRMARASRSGTALRMSSAK